MPVTCLNSPQSCDSLHRNSQRTVMQWNKWAVGIRAIVILSQAAAWMGIEGWIFRIHKTLFQSWKKWILSLTIASSSDLLAYNTSRSWMAAYRQTMTDVTRCVTSRHENRAVAIISCLAVNIVIVPRLRVLPQPACLAPLFCHSSDECVRLI